MLARIPDGEYHAEEVKQIEQECLDDKHHQVLKHELTSDRQIVKSESPALDSDFMNDLVDSVDSFDSVDLSQVRFHIPVPKCSTSKVRDTCEPFDHWNPPSDDSKWADRIIAEMEEKKLIHEDT